jgi:hypothetical protein
MMSFSDIKRNLFNSHEFSRLIPTAYFPGRWANFIVYNQVMHFINSLLFVFRLLTITKLQDQLSMHSFLLPTPNYISLSFFSKPRIKILYPNFMA